ncbi:hypothetical protein EDB83DRAFT_2676968 [Lactarius deliciosus]|nr:hypothetical protein EDB83DRAFT_2323227 [Lactarius deliciosus]KAH9047972.1 hypothetical protein EDB83DRAFT_2676968 [Lactarius deliciosus]
MACPSHPLGAPPLLPALLLLTPIVITFEQLSLPSSRSWCLFTCPLSADPCASPLYILWLLALPSPYPSPSFVIGNTIDLRPNIFGDIFLVSSLVVKGDAVSNARIREVVFNRVVYKVANMFSG